MESVLIDFKNSSEEKVLLAYLKSLKINYQKVNASTEDKALAEAVDKGKQQGRATTKQQAEFETWLKSL